MNLSTFDFAVWLSYFPQIITNLGVTFTYLGGTLVIGVVIGFFFAWAKVGNNRLLRGIAVGYTAIMRSVPPIILLFLVYYGLPRLSEDVFGVTLRGLDKVVFVILTLGLLSIAYFSEIMKSAYRAVDKGQTEAALTNGLTRAQAFRRIVLPQAVRIAIPNFGNVTVMLLKEGSLGYTIGLLDIMGRAYQLNTVTYSNHILEIYFALAATYWLLAIVIDRLFKAWQGALTPDGSARRPLVAVGGAQA